MTAIVERRTSTARTTIEQADGSSMAPVKPEDVVRKNSETKAPTMNTSPWAKLMSSMIP